MCFLTWTVFGGGLETRLRISPCQAIRGCNVEVVRRGIDWRSIASKVEVWCVSAWQVLAQVCRRYGARIMLGLCAVCIGLFGSTCHILIYPVSIIRCAVI